MLGKGLNKVKPGEVISASHYNELVDSVNRLTGLIGAGGRDGVNNAAMISFLPNDRSTEILARITGNSGFAHSWEEVEFREDGEVVLRVNGRKGSTFENPAYNTDYKLVPPGAIVVLNRAYPSGVTGWQYWFHYHIPYFVWGNIPYQPIPGFHWALGQAFLLGESNNSIITSIPRGFFGTMMAILDLEVTVESDLPWIWAEFETAIFLGTYLYGEYRWTSNYYSYAYGVVFNNRGGLGDGRGGPGSINPGGSLSRGTIHGTDYFFNQGQYDLYVAVGLRLLSVYTATGQFGEWPPYSAFKVSGKVQLINF